MCACESAQHDLLAMSSKVCWTSNCSTVSSWGKQRAIAAHVGLGCPTVDYQARRSGCTLGLRLVDLERLKSAVGGNGRSGPQPESGAAAGSRSRRWPRRGSWSPIRGIVALSAIGCLPPLGSSRLSYVVAESRTSCPHTLAASAVDQLRVIRTRSLRSRTMPENWQACAGTEYRSRPQVCRTPERRRRCWRARTAGVRQAPRHEIAGMRQPRW